MMNPYGKYVNVRNDKARFFTDLAHFGMHQAEDWRPIRIATARDRVQKVDGIECCIRDSKGDHICTKKLIEEDYYYEITPKAGDKKYLAFCKEHWELP